MRILALEPYAALSHRLFLEELAEASSHDFQVELLPPRKWKWRMRTSSLHWARWMASVAGANSCPWDLLLVSDFVNLAELMALLPPHLRHLPSVIYFHENQLTYPNQNGGDQRDLHFAFTNLTTARILIATVPAEHLSPRLAALRAKAAKMEAAVYGRQLNRRAYPGGHCICRPPSRWKCRWSTVWPPSSPQLTTTR